MTAFGTGDPESSLIQATDGNLYGTAFNGIFQMNLGGIVTPIYTWPHDTSKASLLQATDGNFYGTTVGSGTDRGSVTAGSVFKLSLGLAPFVKPQPASGKVGASITILGNNLGGVTAVTFNGTSAGSFTVNSTASAISVAVPAGATTGTIQVSLRGGTTLFSNVPFRVLQ